jgi:hypothetical protein
MRSGDFRRQLQIDAPPREPKQGPRADRNRLVVNHLGPVGADLDDDHRIIAEPAIQRLGEMETLELTSFVGHGCILAQTVDLLGVSTGVIYWYRMLVWDA